ncbi:tyrosine-type recombinase/integrase [Kribbella sp. NPDC051587]|uniref:tyrosine-type recombinase/integrase n=1 Tax=Kribbella sp. NPDC051587 TaxID=3364119 RepID=UPI003799CB1C
MAFTKDQWTRAVKQPDGSVVRERIEPRWGRGKRWLAVWLDPSGKEVSKAFSSKARADKYGAEMETDIGRGEYVAPRAGSIRFKVVLERWPQSRFVDPSTWITYERALRLHVLPTFGERETGAIRPSEFCRWLVELETRVGTATARTAFIVLHGSLGLAFDDGAIKRNPAKAGSGKLPVPKSGRIVAWSDETVLRVVEAHPAPYRAIPVLGAASGLRQGELFGLGEEDIDFDAMEIHVRRQIKRLGSSYVFALPKNDQERTVPMSDGAAEVLRRHIEISRVRPYSLPWEKPGGEEASVRLLFRWRDDRHIRARGYNERIWKPALVAADVIPPPVRNDKGALVYLASRKDGMHALRHYYASVTLADGVNIRELSEYLGHGDPGFTLRLYTHMLPSSHQRARLAIDSRLSAVFASAAHGAVTEQAASQNLSAQDVLELDAGPQLGL